MHAFVDTACLIMKLYIIMVHMLIWTTCNLRQFVIIGRSICGKLKS